MEYTLPKTVQINGKDLEIRTDFRVILTILELIADPDLDDRIKAQGVIEMFYVDPPTNNAKEAIEACYRFIDLGESEKKKKSPRVMDWEQDFKYIVAPVNRVLGYECRSVPYDYDSNTGGLHWWTFMGAYMEVGPDCMFSQIVSVRDKQARGKKLEKYEREWLNRNRDIVELRQKFSEAEKNLANVWMSGGKKKNG